MWSLESSVASLQEHLCWLATVDLKSINTPNNRHENMKNDFKILSPLMYSILYNSTEHLKGIYVVGENNQ